MANTILQTSLSAKITGKQSSLNVVSATGIIGVQNGIYQKIYVIDPDTTRGELMSVQAVNGTQVTVSRLDMFRTPHAGPSGNGGIGATVLIAPPADPLYGAYIQAFQTFNPTGTGNAAQPSTALQPWVNVTTGEQWLYSSVTGLWIPGWNNPNQMKGVTAAVASAAGFITPSGPLFHVTGTAAITGFTLPIGFSGGSFTIIPDGVFSWTAANNIATASGTVAVGVPITFQYDSNTGKFFPSTLS